MALHRRETHRLRTWILDRSAVAHAHERAYRRAAERHLAAIETTFQVSPAELGRLVGGVTRQAIQKWFAAGVPHARFADVARVADLARRLRRTFRAERIPGIVRQPNPGLGGESVLAALAQPGGVARVHAALDRLASYVPAP